jgi:predicted transposase/invertase (TIGR01784 family)
VASRHIRQGCFARLLLSGAARMLVAMETDSFFWKLLKQLPQTLFDLLGLPPQRARRYRFDSVEVKKSFRIDGLFLPSKAGLPLYFVEVQFRRLPTFYANLFAKVFCYLEDNDPGQDWLAVAIFPSRSMEPKELGPYEDLLQSRRVRRIYLDSHPMPANPPLGLGILQLLSVPVQQLRDVVGRLWRRAQEEFAGTELAVKTIQLVEEFLVRRFPKLGREEIRAMFQLEDLRKTRVWQEAREEGREERGEELVHKWMSKGMTIKEIAALLDTSVQEVRRLSKNGRR